MNVPGYAVEDIRGMLLAFRDLDVEERTREAQVVLLWHSLSPSLMHGDVCVKTSMLSHRDVPKVRTVRASSSSPSRK